MTTPQINAQLTRQAALREMLIATEMPDAIVYDRCGAAIFLDAEEEQRPVIPGLWMLRLIEPIRCDFFLYTRQQDDMSYSLRLVEYDTPYTPIFDFQVHLTAHEVIDLQLQIVTALVHGWLPPVCAKWSVNHWRRFVARTLHRVRERGKLRTLGPN